MKIKIKYETPEDKEFWDSWPRGESKEPLPHIGDDWWNVETELSIELLGLKGE